MFEINPVGLNSFSAVPVPCVGERAKAVEKGIKIYVGSGQVVRFDKCCSKFATGRTSFGGSFFFFGFSFWFFLLVITLFLFLMY